MAKQIVWIVIVECLDGRSSMDETVAEIRLVTTDEDKAMALAESTANEAELVQNDDEPLWWDDEEGMTIVRVDWYEVK